MVNLGYLKGWGLSHGIGNFSKYGLAKPLNETGFYMFFSSFIKLFVVRDKEISIFKIRLALSKT